MRIVCAVRNRIGTTRRNLRSFERTLGLGRRPGPHPGGDDLIQRLLIRDPVTVGPETRIRDQLRLADQLGQPGKDQVRVAGDDQPLIIAVR